MTRDTTSELIDLQIDGTNRPAKRGRRSAFLISASVCMAMCFVGSFLYDASRLRTATVSHQKYVDNLRQLDVNRARLERAEAQAKNDQMVIFDILKQARVAEDIPDFQGKHVVSYSDGTSVSGYLPDGRHDLVITAEWKPSGPNETVESSVTYKGGRSWTIPMTGGTGFRLEIDGAKSYRKKEAGPIAWRLNCNQATFKQRHETVPIGPFLGYSWSMSGDTRFIFVPNQVSNVYAFKKPITTSKPQKRIFQVKLNGKCNKIPHSIEFKAHVLSDGPACIRAAAAANLIQMNEKALLMPYEGGGVYLLRVPPPAIP